MIRARHEGQAPGAGTILLRATGHGLALWAVPVLVLALNQLRVRNCTPVEGLAFLVAGPGVGVVLAAIAGVLWGAAFRRERLATLLAALTPLASAGLGLWEFASTPAIFVYDAFAGWFPGTLYDEDVGFPAAYLTFRGLTVLWGLALMLLLRASWSRGLDRLVRPRALPTLVALGLIALALVGRAHGPELGHRSTAEAIQEALGATEEGRRCVVHAPRELRRASRLRLVRDCDFRVERAEAMLGVRQRRPVHAYFYRSSTEKRRWMGAANTYIAKPWRDEVHLQLKGWPHPVLAHEIVHVVAGATARGPFRVGGSLGGWLPDPGIIEGVAVAIEWPERDGMDPPQWSRAMRELEMLPPLEGLAGLSFLGQPSRNAYTAAGSFLRWVLDTRGAEALRRLYRTGDWGTLGAPLGELEAEWHAFLDGRPLPEGALELARLRFHRASIFARVCPHRVAALRAELAGDLAAGDDPAARETCGEILRIEPNEIGARATLAGVLARQGELPEAAEQLAALEGAPPPLVDQARERIADARWLAGEGEAAAAIYRELLEQPQDDGTARAREVKRAALEAGGAQAELVRELLVGPAGVRVSTPVVVHLAQAIAEVREDGLGPYLEARQMMGQERYDLALPLVVTARERGLPTERIRDEALRMEGVCRYALGQLDEAERRFQQARSRPRLRHEAADWLARIAWRRSR